MKIYKKQVPLFFSNEGGGGGAGPGSAFAYIKYCLLSLQPIKSDKYQTHFNVFLLKHSPSNYSRNRMKHFMISCPCLLYRSKIQDSFYFV